MIKKRRLVSGESFNLIKFELIRLLAQLHSCDESRILEKEGELRESLGDTLSHTLAAFDDENDPNRFLGIATIVFRRNLMKWFCDIHNVVVDAEHRRKGIGEFLLTELLDLARQFSAAKRIRLEINSTSCPGSTAVNALYSKLGFELIAETRGPSGKNLYRLTIEPKSIKGLY